MTKFTRISPNYPVLEMSRRNYAEVNVIHRALAEVLERLALDYAVRIAKDDCNLIPISIRVEVKEALWDLEVRLHVEEIEYKI